MLENQRYSCLSNAKAQSAKLLYNEPNIGVKRLI
jgi:hypothetical protein